ncbi:MAG: dihydrofolate reductase family protein [Gammaproteobacteria bacterium]|nr:dihydrofolate reductase family protein [Gammaproteobacteria bacterium]
MSDAGEHLQRLWPLAGAAPQPAPLKGTYLSENLHRQKDRNQPFIYANYVSSIDGRIAVAGEDGSRQTPEHLKTGADWTLFKELQAQAECLLTHSGYLRALEAGTHGDVLHISNSPENRYLGEWRQQADLPPQPTLLIVSRSLDFTWPTSLDANVRPVFILTNKSADADSLHRFREYGASIISLDNEGLISASEVNSVLGDLGLRNAYLQTGPDMLRSMLSGDLLQRLYLTLNLSLVGGSDFLTMLNGSLPNQYKKMNLRSLYFSKSSTKSKDEQQQLFAAFDL